MSSTIFGVSLVILCSIVEGFSQLFWKKSVLGAAQWKFWVTLGIAFHILQILFYVGALRFLQVSIANPITSLSFVTVAVLSQWFLRESVTKMRWIGIGLILIGTGLLVARA
jgi:undecaprenyl phosphate-alpha-L-ara4N flippase subunit ArnE